MRGRPAPADAAARIERSAWVSIGVVSVLLLGLAVASGLSYTSVIVAHATVYLEDPRISVALEGVDPDGILADNGTLTVTLQIPVMNPSDRSLHLRQVVYCGWIEDLPLEKGLNDSRRNSDARLAVNGSVRYFYPVFCPATSSPTDSVPARGNTTISLSYVLRRTDNPSAFAAVRNITEYAAHVLKSAVASPWNHWVQVVLSIDGVPPATSPTAGTYLLKVHLITRVWGILLVS